MQPWQDGNQVRSARGQSLRLLVLQVILQVFEPLSIHLHRTSDADPVLHKQVAQSCAIHQLYRTCTGHSGLPLGCATEVTGCDYESTINIACHGSLHLLYHIGSHCSLPTLGLKCNPKTYKSDLKLSSTVNPSIMGAGCYFDFINARGH